MSASLRPTHEGYRHQDLVGAIAAMWVLTGDIARVAIDRKTIAGDVFDDLALIDADGKERRLQAKLSTNSQKVLALHDLKNASSAINLERLLAAHRGYGAGGPVEYRLYLTWQQPTDELSTMLMPSNATEFIRGTNTQRLKLRPDVVWPHGEEPALPVGACSRTEFLVFCERFVVETGVPSVQTFWHPGPLERRLIETLQNDIGVSQYPNRKDPTNVAALAVAMVTDARANEPSLGAADIESRLHLRTDYGRVEQRYPIDATTFQRRPAIDDWSAIVAAPGSRRLVTGMPGAGKSWALTALANRLREGGALVARHYCYLEPGDEWVEHRVKHDTLFGNLVAEVLEAAPNLRSALGRRYAASGTELEQLMDAATDVFDHVVLIVDGLDHIGRVRASSRGLSEEQTEIVDRIAALRLPASVTVILGTQPGHHADPLTNAGYCVDEIPAWSDVEILGLLEAHGARDTLAPCSPEYQRRVMSRVCQLADGNPLCATLLSRELGQVAEAAQIGLEPWLRALPDIRGRVHEYYAHLHAGVLGEQRPIAEVLAVLDFAVTKDDLRELVGVPLSMHLDTALASLRPILRDTVSGGGLRIFHESFRRFILDEIESAGRQVSELLELIVGFLESKGFPNDPRAYRYLVPLKIKARGAAGGLELLTPDFVESSFAAGQAIDAIWRNIEMFSGAAASAASWADIVTCVELSRQLDETSRSLDEEGPYYWTAMIAHRGPHYVADRLLYEGSPTMAKSDGLLTCEAVDKAGGVPPWTEYLRLADVQGNDDGHTQEDSAFRERVFLARVRGEIRVDGWDRSKELVVAVLQRSGEVVGGASLDRLLSVVLDTAGVGALRELVDQGTGTVPLPPRVRHHGRLLIAESTRGPIEPCPDDVAWIEVATVLLRREVDLGSRPPEAVIRSRDPGAIELGFSKREVPSLASLAEWFERIRLCARIAPDLLDGEWSRIDGEGWYRSWLRFAIMLARAEVLPTDQRSAATTAAFHELAREAEPFKGAPRPVDLHAIIDVIFDTLDVGFGALETLSDWETALGLVRQAADGTAASLWREPGGPMPLERLLDVLLAHVDHPVASRVVRVFLTDAIERARARGTYYGYHARHLLYAVRMSRGNAEDASNTWREAVRFLCAYGHHKDRTLFELLDSAPALLGAGTSAALKAVAATQRMAEALPKHTDGRETQHAVNAWFRALADADLQLALEVVAAARHDIEDAFSWYVQSAYNACVARVNGLVSKSLEAWGWALVPYNPRYEGEGEDLATSKVESACRLLETDERAGSIVLKTVLGQIADDPRAENGAALRYVSRKFGVPVEGLIRRSRDEPSMRVDKASEDLPSRISTLLGEPLFSSGDTTPATLLSKLDDLRGAALSRRGRSDSAALANAIGYRLLALHEGGNSRFVIRFIRDLASTTWATEEDSLLDALAEGFVRCAPAALACEVCVIAYVRSRGDGGWSPIGGTRQERLLLEAVRLDRQLALVTLAYEAVDVLWENPGSIGITKNLIRRLAAIGEPKTAERMWWAAHAVIDRRIPLRPSSPQIFPQVAEDATASWSVSEGLAALVLTEIHQPVLYRKTLAALAASEIHASDPRPLETAASWFVTRNCPTSSMVLALQAVDQGEEPVGAAMLDPLRGLCCGASWCGRLLGRTLLERVESPPPSPQFEPLLAPGEPISATATKRFEHFVDDGVLHVLGLVPGALDWVKAEFARDFGADESHRDRRMLRLRLAWGQRGECVPATPVLQWEEEVLLGLADHVLNHLGPALWKRGDWRADAELDALEDFVPAQQVHTAYLASRRPRGLQGPSLLDGWRIRNVPTVPADPEFGDWSVFGLAEEYWVPGEGAWPAPRRKRLSVAGTAVRAIGEDVPRDCWPFGKPEQLGMLPAAAFLGMPSGPLCVWRHVSDWLGKVHLVLLAPGLTQALNLELRVDNEGIRWVGTDGYVSAALRTWAVRDDQQYDAAPRRSVGVELLVAPKVRRRIEGLVAGQLVRIECSSESGA